MRSPLTSDRRNQPRTGRSYSLWPVLGVLLPAVLVPTGCLLWFMNLAVRNESLAVRQRLTDVYREGLLAARDTIERQCEAIAACEVEADVATPAERFARIVAAGLVDSVVIRDASGAALYPSAWSPASLPAGPDPDLLQAAERLQQQGDDHAHAAETCAAIARDAPDINTRAAALQAQARCLLRAGHRDQALSILTERFASPELQDASDTTGRLIAPAAHLLALQLIADPDSDTFRNIADRLAGTWLNDYRRPMPASQRCFLMHALQQVDPGRHDLPTLPAEDLAMQYLETEQPAAEPGRFIRTALPGVWHMAGGDGTAVVLLQQERFVSRLESVIRPRDLPGMRLGVRPPGLDPVQPEPLLTSAAGEMLPGWTLDVRLTDPDLFAAESSRRRALYLWTGGAGIALIAILAAGVAGFVSRQMRLTRLKNDLIATVTHELKTPLASMRMLVDTLLEGRYRDRLQVSEYLQLIAAENLRLSRLIDNFLTFSRMERSKRAFEFRPVRIEQVVDAAARAMADRFAGPDCRLDLRVEPDLPEVHGDPDALTTVVLNLLDNAWKYTGDCKCVTIRAAARDSRVVIDVQDNGVGIPPRAQRRIFERFYQVDRSLSRGVGGCGLGLSIVRFIVAAHGGAVSVASQPGQGSTFTVTLPIAEADASNTRRDSHAC